MSCVLSPPCHQVSKGEVQVKVRPTAVFVFKVLFTVFHCKPDSRRPIIYMPATLEVEQLTIDLSMRDQGGLSVDDLL